MSIRLIASVVIAALLMTGGAVTATQVSEYGAEPTEQATTQTTLTQEEAKAIALTHAGLTEAEVTALRGEYDVEKGIPEWDIDFRSGDWEYDYEINAKTGEIIRHEKEYDPVKKAAQKPAQPKETKPAETAPAQTEPKPEKLTAEEAKAIALKHAGLRSDQVKGLRAEFDVDDGIPEWEVEFYADGMEYDYEIHAETGKILSWDKERDD